MFAPSRVPMVIAPFIISFPAGLALYWITTNVWTLGQQFVVTRLAPPVTPTAGGDPPADGEGEGEGKRKRGRGAPATAQAVAAPATPPPPPPRKRKRRSGKRR